MSETRFTTAELDAIEELGHEQGYALFIERVTQELARRTAELEGRMDPPSTDFCRGAIAALRVVLRLRQILIDEAKQDISQEKEHQ